MSDTYDNPFTRIGLPVSNTTSNGSNRSDGRSELGADAFLRMMITQMQNQDPTQPLEADQFVAQLAQFSSVTELQELKRSFDNLASSMVTNQALQGASLVDRSVLVPSEVGYHDGESGIGGVVNVDAVSADVRISIYNSAGELVTELPMESTGDGRARFQWDGLGTDGEPMPAGQYEIRAQAISGGRSVANEILVRARVESVQFGRPGEPLDLNLRGLGMIRMDQVRQIG